MNQSIKMVVYDITMWTATGHRVDASSNEPLPNRGTREGTASTEREGVAQNGTKSESAGYRSTMTMI